MKVSGFLLLIGLSQLIPASGLSQVLIPGYYQRDYYEVLRMKNDHLDGPISVLPSILHRYAIDTALKWDIWNGKFDIQRQEDGVIEILDPSFSFSYSSDMPDSYNDGAVWEGRGLNSNVNFGFSGKFGMLQFTFAPVVYYAQNKDFFVAPSPFGKNEFSYPFERKIDWVMRYGDESLTKIHPGQSEIRLVYKNATIGLSTQSMTWGPAQVTPILMSNNAGGIPHFDIGTSVPVKTKLGMLEWKTFWGLMDESDYFDTNESNDQRYITGTVIGLRPNFAPELSLGFQRVMYRDMFDGDFSPLDIFASLWKNIDDPDLPNDNYDQMASIAIRWNFKEHGFDTYIEFARNDLPGNLVDLFENPERTRASTMGLVKTFDNEDGSLIRFVYEYTKLNKIKASTNTTGHPTYYVHSVVENGYTNNGQIMGAYIGPGSNSHHIKIQYYAPFGMIGGYIDRVRMNDDYFIANFVEPRFAQPNDPRTPELNNDTRFRFGIDYLRFIGKFGITANAALGRIRNWYYFDHEFHNMSYSLKINYIFDKSRFSD
ncbi:MAG: capsule assembly Wzi family protein [Cyclobacteriaceae bacterium]